WRRVPAGDDHVLALWSSPEHADDFLDVEPAEFEAVRHLVHDDDIVLPALDALAALAPALLRQRAIAIDVFAGPGEAVAEGDDLDAHLARSPNLAPIRRLRLDELEHDDRHPAPPRAEEDAQGGRGLSLAIPRIDEHEPFRATIRMRPDGRLLFPFSGAAGVREVVERRIRARADLGAHPGAPVVAGASGAHACSTISMGPSCSMTSQRLTSSSRQNRRLTRACPIRNPHSSRSGSQRGSVGAT